MHRIKEQSIYHKQNLHFTMKVYNNFTDKFGNQYGFDNYMDFSKFWFILSRKVAISLFPANFAALQNAAANSKEARAKVQY